ncbi:hypothetical protein K490DRAFT_76300 [Saccharata proteae CBS 121410]|uniref:RNA polymerase II subunit A C-terminal domain phosphatase n=1 Tax=Saccharata proteae CBS 121410 TaxID=1314787 RepID=A0A9P4HNY7_9PEZI|nr:hypothetical protein K490DRAFT_76300 [Saccharata proteae CBS 121410]
MLLKSPTSFHYPITIKKILRNEGDKIPKFTPLFTYVYTTKVTEHDIWREEKIVTKEMPAELKAEKEGTLTKWSVEEGMTLHRPGIPLVEISEECAHEVQWGGMCANCGKDMSEVNFNTTVVDVDRASVVRTHGTTALKISEDLALKTEEEAKRRLLSSKKLSLVVDLDCTVIHATVDPTVGDWMRDPQNPNHGVVQNVRSFELEDGPGGRTCLYYIKLRPGLREFLDKISQLYELHIYTMGTRAYAQQIAKIVDPDRRVFGDRILSRDESGSVHVKSLKRIFPIDTKMVVIIDDRGDVWNWSNNLIKVTPYDFFVGIGDINASFLPKRQVVANETPIAAPQPAPPPPVEVPKNGEEAQTDVGALEQQIVAMSHRDDPQKMKDQTKEQAEAVATQLEDRPLLQKQKLLDKADEEAADREPNGQSSEENGQDPHQHRHLLHDNDEELIHLEGSLRRVHGAFYDEYERQKTGTQGGRVAELRAGKSPKKRPVDDLELVPDIGYIMPDLKRAVLKGVSIVFSGVVPLGTNIYASDIALWSRSFGAQISEKLTKRTTHVVAARNRRTAKVRQAARHPQIKIVTTSWLYECFAKWERVSEEPHVIHVEPDEHGPHGQISPLEELDEGTVLSSSEEDAALTTDGELGDPNEDEELEDLAPHSPVDETEIRGKAEDWEAMEDELEEFLNASDSEDGDDDDASDSDASQSDRSIASQLVKRKRDGDSTDESEEDISLVSVAGGSKLQRRKRQAMERTTSLTNMATAEKESPSGLPSPDTTGPEEDQGEDDSDIKDRAAADDDADEDADLEAEMLAELERDDDDDGVNENGVED